MFIGRRLRDFREMKNLSQGDIEVRTGLLRCYISRVENGHTVPAIETLEKMACALEMPMYQLFYEDEQPPASGHQTRNGHQDWASHGRGSRYFAKLREYLSRMSADDRDVLMHTVIRIARRPKS